jgi:hypothetical protein
VNVYRRAVDKGNVSRLNAFAVNALAFAIAWLPGQTFPGLAVEVVNEQISPSLFTTAPHMRVPSNRPPTMAGKAAASTRNPLS